MLRTSAAIVFALCHWASAFTQVTLDVIAGPQYDRVALAEYSESYYHSYYWSSRAYVSSGVGGHLGGSMIFGSGSVKGYGGVILAWQHLEGDYVRSEGGGGHGGWGSRTDEGRLTLDRRMVEIPFGFVFGGPNVQFTVGVSYWFLLGVKVHDLGIRHSSSWVLGMGSHESTTDYEYHSNDRKSYAQHGPALTAGWMFIIKKRYITSLSYSRSFWDMYVNDRPSGQLSTVRLGLGYRLISAKID
jgi:hypothetical protein